MEWIFTIWEKVKNAFLGNGIDWILTGIITYFTTRSATRQYYDRNKAKVACKIMEQGLRAMLRLDSSEKLPDNAKVIFVEYKGRCLKIKRKNSSTKECGFLQRIRRTVACVGGDTLGVSSYRPINYGVLGIANVACRPILYDFNKGELYKYENGDIKRLETIQENGFYYYQKNASERVEISSVDTSRDTMIAVPIGRNEKLLGGVTFDMKAGPKTIYQRITSNDSAEIAKEKNKVNKGVMQEARITAENLLAAYFDKIGEGGI